MKVLFISSGNSINGISPIVLSQGESLQKLNIELNYFTIKGKGLIGYLTNISKLKKKVFDFKPDLIHAHYSLSGILCALSFTGKPIITSLMGSDVKSKKWFRVFLRAFNLLFWKECILKSQDMKDSIRIKKGHVIPNGVDIKKFYPINKQIARKKIQWNNIERIVLFAANPSRPEKNYKLALSALGLIENTHIIKSLVDINHDEMVYYYNAADIVLLTSLWEGSPNVIKEAMACNASIVTTNVGDVSSIISDIEGCFITNFNPNNVASTIEKAFSYVKEKGLTKGRDRIIELGLDSESIAKRIIAIYNKVIYQ